MSVDQVAGLAQVCLQPPTPRGADRTTAAGTNRRPPLSDRQKAVLRLITEGLPNKQIATALGIAERTVKAHVTSAMNKRGWRTAPTPQSPRSSAGYCNSKHDLLDHLRILALQQRRRVVVSVSWCLSTKPISPGVQFSPTLRGK